MPAAFLKKQRNYYTALANCKDRRLFQKVLFPGTLQTE
jgi:hypothetical protein